MQRAPTWFVNQTNPFRDDVRLVKGDHLHNSTLPGSNRILFFYLEVGTLNVLCIFIILNRTNRPLSSIVPPVERINVPTLTKRTHGKCGSKRVAATWIGCWV